MRRRVIVDTGPVVAFLDKKDRHHGWVLGELATIEPPLLTCEAVLSEAWHLQRAFPDGRRALLELVSRNIPSIAFDLGAEIAAVGQMAQRYGNVPMSLTDGCLVRMAEIYVNSPVLTLDSDFIIYRRNGRQSIPLITRV